MDKQSIITQLELDINALQHQVVDFKNHPESITSLEWELFVKRLDLMHAYCSKLKLDVQAERKTEERKVEIITTVPVIETHAHVIVSEKKEEQKEEVVSNVEPILIKEETVTAQQMETSTYQNSANTTTVEVKTATQKMKKQTISSGGLFGEMISVADKFKDEPTIGDKIARAKSEKSVADKIHHAPVKDLKDAIGINEKFLYINELFDGNLQDYTESLNKLNAAENISTAEKIIAVLASQYQWQSDQEHVKTFHDLVARKFLA